jgi:hypothetical protein
MVKADGCWAVRCVGVVLSVALTATACSNGDDNDAASADEPASGDVTPDASPERYEGEEFYSVPAPLPDGEPGDLLRYQALDSPTPAGAEHWRIMYLSESVAGETIAVTGLVVVPEDPAPSEGRPVLSVGHGTAGVADVCAPSRRTPQLASLDQTLGAPDTLELLGGFAEAGYVVAMTDYEGLGTPGVHPYLVGESEGRGILDAARAARQLPGADAGNQVGIWGYSQGGHAALWANQLAREWAPELDVIGTVAGGPGADLPTTFVATGRVPSLNDRFVLIVAGFAAAYSGADPSLVLTDAGMRVLEHARTNEVCGAVGVDLSPAGGEPVAREGFTTAEPWVSLMGDNDPGQVATDGVVLILHSAADEVVPRGFSEALVSDWCRLGQQVELRLYDQGEGHVEAMDDAAIDGLAWLEARRAGEPASSNCE